MKSRLFFRTLCRKIRAAVYLAWCDAWEVKAPRRTEEEAEHSSLHRQLSSSHLRHTHAPHTPLLSYPQAWEGSRRRAGGGGSRRQLEQGAQAGTGSII